MCRVAEFFHIIIEVKIFFIVIAITIDASDILIGISINWINRIGCGRIGKESCIVCAVGHEGRMYLPHLYLCLFRRDSAVANLFFEFVPTDPWCVCIRSEQTGNSDSKKNSVGLDIQWSAPSAMSLTWFGMFDKGAASIFFLMEYIDNNFGIAERYGYKRERVADRHIADA